LYPSLVFDEQKGKFLAAENVLPADFDNPELF
jgi:hypothetical protein